MPYFIMPKSLATPITEQSCHCKAYSLVALQLAPERPRQHRRQQRVEFDGARGLQLL